MVQYSGPGAERGLFGGADGGNEIGKHEAGRYTGKHETGRHTGSIFWKPWHFIVRNLPRFPDGV